MKMQNIAHFICLLKEASSADAQTIISGMQPANLELYKKLPL